MERKVTLVDLFDRAIGETTKSLAHREAKLHRAFSVFVYSGTKILIQKRASDKYHSAGLCANTCCSHPRPSEELFDSAKNRLYEETGIVCSKIEHLFEFTYYVKFDENLYEYEYDHVLLTRYDGKFCANKDEIEEMCWVEAEELMKDMLENPHRYAHWFLICAPRVIRHILK